MNGLKSLNDKMNKIDSKVNKLRTVDFENIDFEDVILINIENAKKQEKKKLITKIKNHYMKGLEDVDNDSNKIISLLVYSIKCIESNIDSLAHAMTTIVTSEFKLSTCISLSRQINTEYETKFLTNSINVIVDLLYNNKPVITPVEKEPLIDAIETRKVLSRKKSIKKHFLKSSKHI
jgi:hypothetical protein